jgi:hypothetical protein
MPSLYSLVRTLFIYNIRSTNLTVFVRVFSICLLLFTTSGNAQNNDTRTNTQQTCISGVYSDKTYLEEAISFYAYDDVYLKYVCSIFTPGNHTINLEWINPEGVLQKNSSHSFDLDSNQDYVVFFSFRLNQNGIFSQIFTGEEFAENQYGEWKIISYLDDHRIGEKLFHIIK